jgi:hypothetical protein
MEDADRTLKASIAVMDRQRQMTRERNKLKEKPGAQTIQEEMSRLIMTAILEKNPAFGQKPHAQADPGGADAVRQANANAVVN